MSRREEEARKDERDKMRLEEIFKPDIRNLFRRMVKDFTVKYAGTGQEVIASNYKPAWAGILDKHYVRVQNKFKGRVRKINRKQEEELSTLEELILLALLEWRDDRAEKQADIITKTNQRQIQDAVQEARLSLQMENKPTDNRTVAATAAAILRRKYVSRVDLIAETETQASAESTKNIEANETAKFFVAPVPTKTWTTVGDKRVRQLHRNINGQTVSIDMPFRSGGELLMFPGDTSLGATSKNISRCRCAAFYNLF